MDPVLNVAYYLIALPKQLLGILFSSSDFFASSYTSCSAALQCHLYFFWLQIGRCLLDKIIRKFLYRICELRKQTLSPEMQNVSLADRRRPVDVTSTNWSGEISYIYMLLIVHRGNCYSFLKQLVSGVVLLPEPKIGKSNGVCGDLQQRPYVLPLLLCRIIQLKTPWCLS